MRVWSCLSLALFLIACGDRTGLLVPDERGGSSGSASSGSASSGAGDDGGTQLEPDAGVLEDALPPIDVTTVPQDAFNDCPNANSTFIYVVTEQSELLSFYPPTAQFRSIGHLNCPTTGPSPSAFSMAVDRTGIAYVLFAEDPRGNTYGLGELFRVSTATARCRATGFVSGQGGFSNVFGMGYSGNGQGIGETLYVAGTGPQPLLASIDTTTFALKTVAPFAPPILNTELTGTGAGDLFGFFSSSVNGDASIGQIDKATGQLIGQSPLKGLSQGMGWAFAFWGGDFYTFTAPNGSTVVSRFRPSDNSLVTVAKRSDKVVGAGVSTCAPAQ